MLNEWAIKWGVPFAAVEDLRRQLGVIADNPSLKDGKSETAVQNDVRLEASRKGARLWRNNVGGAYDETGRHVRYGLCNETPQMNKIIKSSDLIGICPVTITPAHVGGVIGQFLAREIKAENWAYTGKGREVPQLNYINLVNSLGGNAAFANRKGTI